MQTSSTAPFLAALNNVLIEEPSNIGLTDGDLFFLANDTCEPHQRIPYHDYLLFTHSIAEATQVSNAEVLGQVELLIKNELLKFRKHVNKATMNDAPNWRRLVLMLNNREKRQQLEQKQILTLHKPTSQNKQPVAPTGTESTKVEPTKPEPVAEPVTAEPDKQTPTLVMEEPKTQTTKYDLTTPLKEKWKNRFRPDWPWYNTATNIIHLTLEQLQDIEAEIAAEKAAGLNHPYERFIYKPQGAIYTSGFFSYTANGFDRLPNCTPRDLRCLKDNIVSAMAEQEKQGWVVNRK